jgi:hypothetical protein
VLFAILFAWLLLGQLPSPVQFLGGAFILAGVTVVRVDELRPAPARASRPAGSRARRSRARVAELAGRGYGGEWQFGMLPVKGSSPSPAGRHTGASQRPAPGPRFVVDETFGC